jgi:hypothetical protein
MKRESKIVLRLQRRTLPAPVTNAPHTAVWWTRDECAAAFRISPRTLDEWRERGLPTIVIERTVRFDPVVVAKWAAAHTVVAEPTPLRRVG